MQKKQVDEFFAENYHSLLKYCCKLWKSQGGDVLNSTFILAKERYKNINFSLFTLLCAEAAAREVEMYRYGHDENGTIILPPTPKAAERLDLSKEVEEDEHVKKLTKIAKKMAREHQTGQMCLFLAPDSARSSRRR